MNRHVLTFLALLANYFLLCAISFAQSPDPKFFNQSPPSTTPVVFAPGLVSIKDQFEFGSFYSKDRTEFFYGVSIKGKAETRMMKYENGKWTTPVQLLVHDTYSYNDPSLTPDQKKLFVISDRPASGQGPKKDFDIWYIERNGSKWSEPKNAGPNINTNENQYYISFTKDGKMYYSSNLKANGKDNYEIHSSALKNGSFQPSEKLGPNINTPRYEGDVFIAPDESYMVFCANHEGGKGQGDLYVSFRNTDGTWAPSKSLGDEINTETDDFCPFVTSDGKYLLYSSRGDIYWVSMEVVMKLK